MTLDGQFRGEVQAMRETERDSGADWKRDSDERVGVGGPGRSRQSWSAEEKVRLVHKSS